VNLRNLYKDNISISNMVDKKGVSRLLLFLLAGLFFSVIVGGLASASPWDDFQKSFSDVFSGEDEYPGLNKFMLMTLLALIIYSISDSLPFIEESNEFIKWTISIIISFISFIAIKADTISALLIQYEALGVVVTSVLPLIIILTLSVRLARKNPGIASIVNPILYIGFAAYIIIVGVWPSITSDAPFTPFDWVYAVTLVLIIVWLIANKKIMGIMSRSELEAKYASAKSITDAATQKVITDAESQEALAGAGGRIAQRS